MMRQSIGKSRLLLLSATLASVFLSSLPETVDAFYYQPLKVPAKPMECPDKQMSCQEDETCCKLKDKSYGCCPAANATCCPDGVHCCPSGTTCDDKGGKCNRKMELPGSIRYRSVPSKLNAKSLIKKTNDLEGADLYADLDLFENSKCTEGGYYCPDFYTCCPAKDGGWACCPLHNGTCCADMTHCCPGGTTCNLEKNTCEKETRYQSTFAAAPMMLKKKISEKDLDPKKETAVVCPDKEYTCPNGDTCCKLSSEGFGCCPMQNATCCNDGMHCCPSGTTCDLERQTCNKNNKFYSTIISSLIPAKSTKEEEEVSSVVCPDKVYTCPTGNTCCKHQPKGFGCCPMPDATCCSDGMHCCPSGTTCDLERQTCNKGDGFYSTLFSSLLSITSVKEEELFVPQDPAIICPDKEYTCPSGNTCCKLPSEGYGCCPMPDATCCSDGLHCCPSGTTCDLERQTCTQDNGIDVTIVSLMTKKEAKKIVKEQVPNPSDLQVECPDKHECSTGESCCQMMSGDFGCCPLNNATCCSDGIHCCPHGTTCDGDAKEMTCKPKEALPVFANFPQRATKAAKIGKAAESKMEESFSDGKRECQGLAEEDVCLDGSCCPEGSTCCPSGFGTWGCCLVEDVMIDLV